MVLGFQSLGRALFEPQVRFRKFRLKPRLRRTRVRIKTRSCYVRVDVERTLVLRRVEKAKKVQGRSMDLRASCDMLLSVASCVVRMASCCAWHVCLCLKHMGDDETESSTYFEECRLRALRGLLLPGKRTHSEPIELDAPMNLSESPRELRERDEPGASEPPEPIQGGPDQGQGVSECIPLRSVALHVHRSHGHYPYDVNCESCCSSKGRVPARRLRRNLQKEDQTIGIGFFYFGKLRVLLMVHCSSRYTISLPAMELSDPNLIYNIDGPFGKWVLSERWLPFAVTKKVR